MSEVSSVSSTQKTIDQIIAANEANKIGSRNTGELGKDDFLQLLITQLQHQDPMNPSSDTEFIAQVAQFSALEQMQNMNSSILQQQGYAMMGKYISATVSDETTGSSTIVTGQVTGVKVVSGEVLLVVGENEVKIENVEQVSDTSAGVGGEADLNRYNTLIGLMGTADIFGDNGRVKQVDGIVSKLEKTDAGIVATLDEVEIIPVIDKGAYESEEAWLASMTGRSVTLDVVDATTGAEISLTGTLRQYETASDEKLHVILDGVEVNVDDITATRRVDLFSSEQLLLAQILQQLIDMNGGAATETDAATDAETETDAVEETGTEAATETTGDTAP